MIAEFLFEVVIMSLFRGIGALYRPLREIADSGPPPVDPALAPLETLPSGPGRGDPNSLWDRELDA